MASILSAKEILPFRVLEENSASSSSNPTDAVIFVGISLVLGIASRHLLRGTRVPYTVALLVLGIGLGSLGFSKTFNYHFIPTYLLRCVFDCVFVWWLKDPYFFFFLLGFVVFTSWVSGRLVKKDTVGALISKKGKYLAMCYAVEDIWIVFSAKCTAVCKIMYSFGAEVSTNALPIS